MAIRKHFHDPFGDYLKGPDGPLFLAKAKECEGRIERLRGQIRLFNDKPRAPRSVLEFAIRELESSLIPEDVRLDVVRQVVSDLTGQLQNQARGHRFDTRPSLVRLMRAYGEFDIESLLSDFDVAFPESDMDPDPAAEIKRIEEEIELIQMEIADLWPDHVTGLVKFFREDRIPESYKGMVLGKNVDAQQMARRICEDYINEYRTRAIHFNVPVTFNGIMIRSLSGRAKDTWTELYAQLKLSPAMLRNDYIPSHAKPEREFEDQPTNPMFRRDV